MTFGMHGRYQTEGFQIRVERDRNEVPWPCCGTEYVDFGVSALDQRALMNALKLTALPEADFARAYAMVIRLRTTPIDICYKCVINVLGACRSILSQHEIASFPDIIDVDDLDQLRRKGLKEVDSAERAMTVMAKIVERNPRRRR